MLQEQIKDNQRKGHRERKSLTHMNQLAILRNFVMLCIKGLRHIAASEEITWQWHEGRGIHFACQIRFVACHYQLFEQLLAENRGGDRGRSLLDDETIQAAAKAHLSSLPMGKVTPQ